MENASKALILAASVLIGIMILSIAVYLVVTLGKNAAEVNSEIEDNQIAQFNSQFLKYDGKTDVTIHDIITLANIARTNNENYDITYNEKSESSYYINIIKGTEDNQVENNSERYMKNEGGCMDSEYDEDGIIKKYTCTVKISPITKRVYEVIFN